MDAYTASREDVNKKIKKYIVIAERDIRVFGALCLVW